MLLKKNSNPAAPVLALSDREGKNLLQLLVGPLFMAALLIGDWPLKQQRELDLERLNDGAK